MRSSSALHWSAYPALVPAGAFASGILLDAFVGWKPPFFWRGCIGLGVLLFVLVHWREKQRMVTLAPLGRVVAIALLGLGAGGASHTVYTTSPPRALGPVVEKMPDRPLTVLGTVTDAPERSKLSTRFTLVVDEIAWADSLIKIDGKVRVTLRPSPWEKSPESFPRIYEGDRLRLTGVIRPAPGQRNPGGFDYGAYLARRGVCCTAYVERPSRIRRLDRSSALLTSVVVRARQHIRRQIRRYVPSADGRAVLQALLLGDRSRVTDEQRQQFAKTGLMHLLAVSGLHVFLVGMVLYILLRPLLMRLRLRWQTVEIGRAGLTVVVLCLYMLLTGMRPSVVRAVVMSTLFIGGVVFQRSTHPLNTLGVAALVLLAVRPPALFDAGFQLSMAAVAAIVTIDPRFKEWIPSEWTQTAAGDWLISTITVSAAATIGTAPVLLFHFGWVSVAGLFLNVVGIPCTGLALSAAVMMTVVGELWSLAGAAFGSTADLFVRGLLLISHSGATWLSWGGLRMPNPSPWVLGALVCGSEALAQWPRPRYRWRCTVCALLLATAGVWAGVFEQEANPTLDLLFFDVGQGDAALITTPEERRILVDTGPRSPYGGSAAASSILPFLRRRGIHRLDLVVVTHPDEDHLGGLPLILQEVDVGKVIHSGQKADTDLFRETRRMLSRLDVRSSSVQRGDVLSVGRSIRIEVLGPPVHPERWGIESENGRSVVLRVGYGRTDVLLPGDIEAAAEQALVQMYERDLGSRVVKLPHHGSETSSTSAFVHACVDSTRETHAVVSVGRENRFGMPSGDVLARWRSEEAQLHSIARTGAVWLRSDGEQVWTVHWRE